MFLKKQTKEKQTNKWNKTHKYIYIFKAIYMV